MPDIKDPDRRKPLCFDRTRKRYIYFDDILSGREQIVPLEQLTEDELKQLVIERHRAGPDYRVQAMSGQPLTRDDVVSAIEKGEPFGRMTLEAEASALRDLLSEISRNLPTK